MHRSKLNLVECGENRINMSERIADSSKPDDSAPSGDPKQEG